MFNYPIYIAVGVFVAGVTVYQFTSYADTESDFRMDYLKLAVQWQPGYNHKTGRISRPMFSIHGLWPSRNEDPMKPRNCKANPDFDSRRLANLRIRLNEAWPSLQGGYEGFWRMEWNRHGKCTVKLPGFGGVEKYFSKTLDMFDNTKINENLKNSQIKPSNEVTINYETLLNVLTKDHDGKKPELNCLQAYSGYGTYKYLKEVRYCYDASEGYAPRDCPDMGNCGDQIMLVLPNT